MNDHSLPTAADQRYSPLVLIRRLLAERAFRISANTLSHLCSAVAAGCTALSAWLIGDVINQAYVNRTYAGLSHSASSPPRYRHQRFATYGHSVMLLRIGNRIVADNQRAVLTSC
jgi:ATP-binding cassette subfamily B protein